MPPPPSSAAAQALVRVAGVVAIAVAGAAAAAADRGEAQPVATLAANAARAGLRVVEGRHLTLATDRPVRAGDGIDALPQLFDEAFPAWCRHFGIDPAAHGEWRAFGCLVVDRRRFHDAGLLPDTIPDFANGYCAGNRFWMMDQSNAAYRRHLLLHEGVHAFTLTLRTLATPPWYTEGIAEFLATHRLDRSAEGAAVLTITPMPQAADDVEQLGRIEAIRRLRESGMAPSLDDVFSTAAAAHHEVSAYATSWAAVAMLGLHPRYAAQLAAAERGGLSDDFTARLTKARGWNAAMATRDFDAFTDDLDYGYDFKRSAIDWSPGRPLAASQTVRVAADRGWQNSGAAMKKGRHYTIRASGRVELGQISAPSEPATDPRSVLLSEPGGISLDWYRGRPLGRLLAAQWVEPEDGSRPRFVVLADGAADDFTAAADGPLYLKINEPPGSLADNAGEFTALLRSHGEFPGGEAGEIRLPHQP